MVRLIPNKQMTINFSPRLLVIIVFIASLCSVFCGSSTSQSESKKVEVPEHEEASSGVIELIDEDLSKWRNFKTDTLSGMWQVSEGILELTGKGGGDIVTKDQFTNFVLELEWKISEGGNSGIFFHVVENEDLGAVWHSGPEVQILDNERHKDAKIHMHRAGDNYDLHACSEETVKPALEWNRVKLVVDNGHVEQWLNGTKVVEYQLGDEDWTERYEKSKFADKPMYGKAGKGHIALQDHGDQVWFRNIQIEEI